MACFGGKTEVNISFGRPRRRYNILFKIIFLGRMM